LVFIYRPPIGASNPKNTILLPNGPELNYRFDYPAQTNEQACGTNQIGRFDRVEKPLIDRIFFIFRD
jgi:hypothetical protein